MENDLENLHKVAMLSSRELDLSALVGYNAERQAVLDNTKIIEIDPKTLHNEALMCESLMWEMEDSGRSPRTARQLIDWLEAKIKGDAGE